ncbi:hypothetical protein [Anatilimnocola floriformis]|uniref:hypothetical protein n=1 Tax=Anatilimnocola floriformis TaxID=2948575 RepID=UPI0020C5504A|nr:hypothetical protein [Anatilimnocola floriformis]
MTRESRAPLIVAIVLLLLPVLYVGSYLALVVPGPPIPGAFSGIRPGTIYRGPYRYGKEWADRLFWPLEQIDRKLRPETWRQMDNLRRLGSR